MHPGPDPGRGPAKLSDIAAATGLSLSTVSRVLNRRKFHERLRPETAERVRAAARRLGYLPHLGAQALATNRSRVVGLAAHLPGPGNVSAVRNGYVGEIVGHAEVFLRSRSYDLLLLSAADAGELPARCAAKFRGRQIDGVLAAGDIGAATLRALDREGIPAVAADYAGPAGAGSHVSLDNRGAVELALAHLEALGHRRVAFLGRRGPGAYADIAVRRRAFRDGAARRGWSPSWADWPALEIVDDAEAGAWAAGRIAALPSRRRPTALVAVGEYQAFTFLQSLTARGLSCPGDVSIVSFDDSPLTLLAAPPLTVIDHSLQRVTERACALLLERIEDAAAKPGREKIAGRLIVRGSTGPAPRG